MIYSLLVDLYDIASAIGHAFRWLFGLLSTIIYNLIIVMYDLFEYLARAEILNSTFVQNIYEKVGFLLGLFMLFKLIFSLIQSLIDPEKLNDKKSGYTKVLIRCIFSIVLLGLTPTIFKEAFKIQNLLIGSGDSSDNVLYKLILGDANVDSSSFGRVLATETYFAFYRDDEYPYLSNYRDTTTGDLQYFDEKIEEIKETIREGEPDNNGRVKNFSYAGSYLNYVSTDKEYVVEFNELLSVLVGAIILWMLVMYCLQIATRIFQLAYLQLIAPIPILSYISDPEGSFKKWINQCIATFLDLFIRLAIIYFVVYFASYIVTLFEDKNSELILSTGINSSNFFMMSLFEIFLLIGLLQFANKVPNLIKDLFPNLGSGAGKFDFGLKPSKQAKGVAAFGLGTTIGALGAAGSNAIHGYMNVRKAFKDNGGIKSGKAWKAAAGAGTKGIFSVAGGALGGTRAGMGTKNIKDIGKAVKVANENREKRELKSQAGYHWYRPDKVVNDKILSFAGETTGAEKQIKSAEFRKEALQRSKQIQWENFARNNPNADLALLTSMQEFEVNGKKVWKGVDSNGNERTFNINTRTNRAGNVTTSFIATDGLGDISSSAGGNMIFTSSKLDKNIKEQNKTIKGLQTANNDAKK